jgi:hypothetical protein
MTIPIDKTSNSFAPNTRGIVAWLVFFSLVFTFGVHKSLENAREDEALREWTVRQAELSKEGEAEWRRLIARCRSLMSQPGSQKVLEDELNGGQPFDLRPLKESDHRYHEGKEAIEWSHPKHGNMFTLLFKDGVLHGCSGGWGGHPESLHPRPVLQADSNAVEWLRQRIARAGTYAWLVAIACWSLQKTWRLRAAQVALAASLACGMAWVVNPHYTITWRGVFSNDPLFFAVIMISTSVTILAVTLAAQNPVHALRPQFGLRHALIAITAIAILLASGPFGYLTLVVGVLGVALFAGVYLLNYAHWRATLRWMAKRGYSQS